MKKQKESKVKKVVLTGGHAGGFALAVVDEVKRKKKLWELHWIGPVKSVEGKKARTFEAKVFPKKDIKFHSIFAGRVQKKLSIYTLPALLRLPLGFAHGMLLLLKIKPDIVLSFGGFAALPVVVSSYFLKIPVVVQEQITGLGLANRLSVPFAKKVLLARKQGLPFVSKKKRVLTGNPIRHSIIKASKKRKLKSGKNLFIFTGSRGSQIINKSVKKILPDLLIEFSIYHLTGELDYERFKKIKKSLPSNLRKRYHIYDFIKPNEVAKIYRKTSILVGRAGANTVSEIMVLKIPSVLIPIPWSKFNEQYKNALVAKEQGIAVILEQTELSPDNLYKKIRYLYKKRKNILEKAKSEIADLDKKAAGVIVKILEDNIK